MILFNSVGDKTLIIIQITSETTSSGRHIFERHRKQSKDNLRMHATQWQDKCPDRPWRIQTQALAAGHGWVDLMTPVALKLGNVFMAISPPRFFLPFIFMCIGNLIQWMAHRHRSDQTRTVYNIYFQICRRSWTSGKYRTKKSKSEAIRLLSSPATGRRTSSSLGFDIYHSSVIFLTSHQQFWLIHSPSLSQAGRAKISVFVWPLVSLMKRTHPW